MFRNLSERFGRRESPATTWRRRVTVAAVLLTAELIAIWPLFKPGLPGTADLMLHLIRAVELDHLVSSGVLYPRWAPDFAYGYGFPIFNFYAPLGTYLIAALHWLGLDFPVAVKVAVLGIYLAYGPTMYWFAARFVSPAAATVAAVAYAFVPFRFRELYSQGDFPQLLAFAIVPLAFASVHDLATRPTPRSFAFTVASSASVLLTHNLTAVNVGGFLALYGLLLASVAGWRRLIPLALAGATALAVTAFFWLPALAERGLVQVHRLTIDDYLFSKHFPAPIELILPSPVLDRALANPQVPHTLGVAHVGLSVLTLLTVPFVRRLNQRERLHLLFGWSMLIVAVFMMLPLSTPVWERAPFVAYNQFPWRFRTVAGLATAVLVGLAAHWMLRRLPRLGGLAFPALLLLMIGPSLVQLYPAEPFQLYAARSVDDVVRFERETGAIGTTSTGEYYPIWVRERPGPSPDAGKLDPSSLPDGATARLAEWQPLRQRYQIELPAPARLTWNVLLFPGWMARVDGAAAPLEIVEPHGLIGVPVPAGSHEVELTFESTPLRTGAELLSALGLVATALGLLLWQRRSRSALSVAEQPTGVPAEEPAASAVGFPLHHGVSAAVALLLLLGLKEGLLDRWSVLSYRSAPGTARDAQQSVDVLFGERIRLIGYDLSPAPARPGDRVRVALYWQAAGRIDRDYRSYVRLVRRSTGEIVVLSDHVHPGAIPTRTWDPLFYVRDEHVLELPADTAPQNLEVLIGLYDERSGDALETRVDGAPSDLRSLTSLKVRPAPLPAGRIGNPLDWRFEPGIRLIGYRVEPSAAAPGDVVALTLYWRADQAVPQDYTVFVHLLDSAGRVVAQGDGMPSSGEYPTSQWVPGDVVEDPHQVLVPRDLASGDYRFLVGLYDLKTLQRLEMRAPDGERTHQLLLNAALVVERPSAGRWSGAVAPSLSGATSTDSPDGWRPVRRAGA